MITTPIAKINLGLNVVERQSRTECCRTAI